MAKKKKKANFHEDLKDLEISINEFGQVIINKPISELNDFLDREVEDKKLEEAKQEHLKSEEE